ncbi:MAG TPA: PLxRFG domain-containing protein [Acinetobacter johnsonii]|nr:PLxRFG domain-containing protein [Acinetobacter johnsonii]
MNINQHFSNLAAKAAAEGADASQLISQRERLFKDKVIPELTKRGANDTAIVQAREKWYSQTDKVMQSAGLLPKAGQSSRSFAKDKRADKANQEAVKTGSNFPIIKEAIVSTGETIGNLFGQGVGSTIESAAGFVRDIGENERDSISAKLANYGKNLRKEYEGSASTFQNELQAGKHGKVSQLSTGAIQSVPAMIAPFGAAKGVVATAGKIPALKKVAPYLGLGAGVATGLTQNYGEVRRNATANLERDFPTWEKLQGNPLFEQNFQEKLNNGISINQARQQAHAETLDTLSEQAANKYGAAMTAIEFIAPSGAVLGSGILKNAPTSQIGKKLFGGGVDSTLVRRELQQVPRTGMAKLVPDVSLAANKAAAKMVGKQALEEGLQGGIGEYGAQAASANIGGTPVDYGKVGKTILEEGLVGGIMGGGMQSATGGSPTSQAKEAAKQLRNQTNTLRQEEAAARKELADAMQLNDPAALQSAQDNLNNIGAEATKVKAAYDQYGIDTPYFVQRFAAQYQPQQQQAAQQGPAAQPQPTSQPQPAPQAAAQPQPTPAAPFNQGMANTTNLVMDSISNGFITPEEAQAIQTDPIRADVFTLTMTGDVAAAHNVVMNAVSLGNIDTDQAQELIQSITRYSQTKAPKKPSVSSIVNNHVKQQIHPQDRGLFSNPAELDPNTFEPIDPNQPSPFQEDFNEPKEFHNAAKANDYVRINGLTDSHDIEIAEDGTIVVFKKQGIIPDDPNLNDFGYKPKNIVQPTPADPNLSNFSEGMVSVDSLNPENVPDLLDPEEAQQPVQPTPTKQPDHNKPKTFTNYVRASDFVKTNGLKDSHEIIKKGEGQIIVQPKSITQADDPESDQAFDDMLNAVPPIGTPITNPPTAPKQEFQDRELSNAEQITGIFSTLGNAFASAAIGEVAGKLAQGKRVQYFKTASIEAAKKNPNYHVADNEDGSVDVIGVRDDNGVWHGQAPENTETKTEQPAPSGNLSFADKFRDAHLNNPSIKPRLINDEIDSGRSREDVLKEATEIVKAINGSKSKEPLAQPERTDGTTEVLEKGTTIVHGSGNSELKAENIQIIRADGQKQGKKGRVYGGFYGTSEADANQAEGYAGMMGGTPTLYDVKIKPNTKVLNKSGDVTRLSENYINELTSQGYGVVVGKDPRGRTEYVVIDSNAIESVNPRSKGKEAPKEQLSLADQIAKGFSDIASGVSDAAIQQVAGKIEKGEEVKFSKPDSIKSAQSNPNYNVRKNNDGSVSVIGVKKPSGEWVGINPEAKTVNDQKTSENGIQENDAPEGMKSGDIGRKSDNQPFANKSAATTTLKNQGLENSHEVVQLAPSSFVLRQTQEALKAQEPQAAPIQPEQNQEKAKDPLAFPIDKVKEAYGHAHLSPGNTARSFKESFDKFIQAETDDAQALATTEAQQTALDDAINWVKESYINEALPPLLNAASATVSSARAGRNNFNSKQADQRGSALDKATAKFDAELERLKGYAKLKVLAARTPKQKQADAEAEAQAQAEKDAAEQAKVEAKIKADAEAKANKKRASNEWITHPDSAEHMTMEEWKAIGKDYKGITDGVRRHMGVPVWITDEGKSKPKNQSNDVLKVGDTITFSEVFDYALPNEPYTIVTAAKAKITLQSESGGQFSFNPNILAIEKAKNPNLYKVDSAKIEPEQPAPPVEETQASDYEAVRKQFDAVTERLDDGDESLTLDELKAAYKALMDNQESLVSEFSSQTKQQLLDKMHPYYTAMYKSHKKDELVNKWVSNTFRAMDFASGGVVTISYGDKRTMPEIVRDKIEAATQEDLNKYLEEQRQAKIQREKDLEAAEAGMNDPKTMDDFKRIYANGDFKDFKDFYRSLTIPQQALYDELKSDAYNEQRMQEIERNKAYREASNPSHAVESTTEATLFAGKHTKKGTDIWTVTLNGRVDGDAFNDYRSQAKGLGGYYSSYKGGGAVPGFIFDNEATANEFLNLVTGDHEAKSTDPEPEAIAVDPQAEVEVIETDAKRQADKLREKAQAVIDRGEQNINRDRKTNTAKRAGDAARAEERANSAIFLGETLNRIADGIENGSVKYLSRLGAMTQLSHLESLLQRASYDQQRETNAKEREITATTIAYAEFPQYKTWTDSFNNIRSDLKAANPRLAEKLEKTIGIRYHNAYARWLNETNEFGTENYVGQLARKSDGSPAVFKTNIKQAETLVKASNKRAGKDSFEVFKIKNGEYAVISSYETAMENGSWKPTNSDKQMTLTNEFGSELYNALRQYKRKNPSYYMNWLIESMHDSVSRMEKLGIHDPATFRAAMREYLSLRSKEKANDPIKEMERSMIGRSNDGLDFFPTPRNVVEQMIEMADLDSDMKVLEPSAGMGHIADVLKDHGIKPDVIELSGKRQDLLKLKGYSVVGNDFLMFDPKNRAPNYGDVFKTADGKYQGVMRGSGSLGSNRVRLMREDDGQMITYFDRDELELVKMNGINYDRIIMNPPFSDRRDAAHIYHAFDLLADDGVMVAIAGEGVFFGKDKAAKEFQDWLDQVGAEITPLDAGTFNDPSLPVTTGVKARIIKINKADSSGKRFSRSEDLNQVPAHVKENTSGSTPNQIRTELVNRFGEDTIQQLEQKGILSIVPTHTEQGVEGFAENGRVTLIADAITAENIVPVFLHELGGHVGMQGVLKASAYDNLMSEFNRLVKSGNPDAIEAKRLAERESDAQVQADEYLPYLITVAARNQQNQGPAQKLISRVLSAVKAWAVDKLGLNLKLNSNDMVALAERMIKTISKGTPPTPPKGERRYSRSSTANPQNMSRSKQRELLDKAASTAFGQLSLRGAEASKTLSNRTLNLFQTMLHKSLRDETGQFKKTFDLVQGKINHVTFASSKSMDVAPSILTQLEEGGDYWKEVKRVGRTMGHTLSGGKIDKAKVDKDLKKIGDLMFENTLLDNSERHTVKELKQLGFDDDQIGLYNEIRDAIDTSLDTFANTTFSNIYKHLGGTNEEVLELAGQDLDITDHYNEILKRIDTLTKGKPEKSEARQAAIEAVDRVFKKANDLKDQGYVPLMRFGKYFVRIWNPTTGEVSYRQHFESESERNIYFRDQEKKGNLPPGTVLEKGQINELQYKLFQGVSPETVALFAKESGLPIGDAETAYIKYAVQNNHALKRLLKRQGIDGFDTDVKRVLASFVMSNARYSANQSYNPAIDESITNIEDPAFQEDAIRLRDYSLDTQEELAAVKNFAFVWYMGFSAMFGVVNLTQPLLQTLPYLMQYSKDHNTIFKAMGKAITTWAKGTDAMDSKYKAHYERARKEGHLDPQNTWMMQGLERGKSGLGASTWQLVSHASGLFAQASETVNRRTSLFAALDVAESLGQTKLEQLGFKDAYDFAVRTIQETQGIYNKGNRPRVSRGNVGSVLMMYKQFMIAYIEQMVRMQKSGLYGGEDDEFKKKMAALVGFGVSRSVLTMLGILMALSGTTGLPFVRDILDGIETAGGLVGKPVNTEREIQIALHDALGQTMGSAVNTALMDGIVNLNPLIDVKGRMGMGDLIPATAYFSPTTSDYMKSSEISQIAGPIGGLLEKVKESVALAQVGAYGQSGVQLLPKAITSVGQGAIAATTGDYRNMKTGVKTNDVTPWEGVIKILDAQPASIAKEGRVRGYEMKDKSAQTYVNARWKERYVNALESGDRTQVRTVKQEIREYNKSNPRYPVKFNQKLAETNFKKSNQSWQEKRKTVKGLEWMSEYNPYLDQ